MTAGLVKSKQLIGVDRREADGLTDGQAAGGGALHMHPEFGRVVAYGGRGRPDRTFDFIGGWTSIKPAIIKTRDANV